MFITILLIFGNLFYSLFKGKKASSNPWGGVTLEWKVSSPPPLENFETIPTVTTEPYDFSQLKENTNDSN